MLLATWVLAISTAVLAVLAILGSAGWVLKRVIREETTPSAVEAQMATYIRDMKAIVAARNIE